MNTFKPSIIITTLLIMQIEISRIAVLNRAMYICLEGHLKFRLIKIFLLHLFMNPLKTYIAKNLFK